MDNHHVIKVFKALADDTRLDIVCKLISRGESSCQELSGQLQLSQPTLSHHYNKLVDAGVLKSRKEGVRWFYCINKPYLKTIGIEIEKLVSCTSDN